MVRQAALHDELRFTPYHCDDPRKAAEPSQAIHASDTASVPTFRVGSGATEPFETFTLLSCTLMSLFMRIKILATLYKRVAQAIDHHKHEGDLAPGTHASYDAVHQQHGFTIMAAKNLDDEPAFRSSTRSLRILFSIGHDSDSVQPNNTTAYTQVARHSNWGVHNSNHDNSDRDTTKRWDRCQAGSW